LSIVSNDQGLLDSSISQVVADDRGWLWFGSTRGIYKVLQKELDAVADGHATAVQSVFMGKDENVPEIESDDTYAANALYSRKGRVLIPTRSGLAVIRPECLLDDLQMPPARIKRICVDERVLAEDDHILTRGKAGTLTEGAKLNLLPGHHRMTWDFTALSLSAPENVHFEYRLDGLDESWVKARAQRTATYSRLPPGEYRFRVKACSSSGRWNENEAVMSFVVAPFFWQSGWFRLSGLAIITISGVSIGRYISFRRLRRKVRALEEKAAIEKERARIARDIHDDLGGSLTRAALLADLARQDRLAPDKLDGHIKEIGSTIKRVTDSVDEIVWAANPRNDTLSDLLDYITSFAVPFLAAANIRCRIDAPEKVDERTLSPEVRHNLFLVVKESLNNVVRHAEASEVRLIIVPSEESLTITIQDNGCGFSNESIQPNSDGLQNLRQRMHEMGGTFQIEGESGSGAKVSAIYPWTQKCH
jgi:signal transduction histidine kinase